MADFTPIIETAQELIAENGRSVTFVSLNTTPTVSSKPWEVADPRTTPEASQQFNAVFVEPRSDTELGRGIVSDQLLKQSEQIMIIAPGDTADAERWEEVIDGSRRWKIVEVQVLQPGTQVILWFVGVTR